MRSVIRTLAQLTLVVITASLTACGGGRGLEKAMADEHTQVKGNSHTYNAPPDVTLRAVVKALVQNGYTIESSDSALGLIKGTRTVQDPKDKNTSYQIVASASVMEAEARESVVTLAAGQQTIVHHSGHNWTMLPLIPIIPIPTGRNDSTLVANQGGIVEPTFYQDLFTAIERALLTVPAPAAAAVAAAVPAPTAIAAATPAEVPKAEAAASPPPAEPAPR